MNNLKKIIVVMLCMILGSLTYIGCSSDSSAGPRAAGDLSSYTTGSGNPAFNMVYLPAGITSPASTAVADPYEIAETEVTYEMWNTIYTWATTDAGSGVRADGGALYTIAHAGSGVSATHPVTDISWRDMMVWMNALTEYYNAQNGTTLTLVYYMDDTYQNPHRVSTDSTTTTEGTPGTQDAPYVRTEATGFRFLSSNEWELAARYIDDADGDNILDTGEYYPNNYASGADAVTGSGSGAVDIDGDGDAEYSTDVSVNADNASDTASVKSKSPNALGIYDMSGNVWEFLFNLDGSSRIRRGGGYNSSDGISLQVDEDSSYNPYGPTNSIGFRFAKSIEQDL